MERRRSRRKRTRLSVRLDPGAVSSLTMDLTAGGLFVRTSRVYRPGTRLRLTLRLPEGEAEAEGVVRWAKRVPVQLMAHVKGGMGIQFTWTCPVLTAYLERTFEALSEAI